MQALLINLLKKHWPVLILLGLVWFIQDKAFDRGFAARDAIAVKERLDVAQKHAAALQQQRDEYLDSLETYKAMANTAIEAEKEALKVVEAQRKKANDYYAKWQEAKKNVEVEISCTNGTPHFTVGFVGMYNLPIQADYAAENIGLPDIARAAGIDVGAAGVDLSQASAITAEDVLDVNAHNMKVARQCLSERKLFKDYLEKVNAARVQPPADL